MNHNIEMKKSAAFDKITEVVFRRNKATRTVTFEDSPHLNIIVTIEDLPLLRKLKTLSINDVDFSDGMPIEIFQCFKLTTLICENCNIKSIPKEAASLLYHLKYCSFAYNNITEFPYVLLDIYTINIINLDSNQIKHLSDEYDYRGINISMAYQLIDKMPTKGSENIMVNALSADIDTILTKSQFTITPPREWIISNGIKLKGCCNDAIIYTKYGDRIINTCLRQGILPIQLESFYNKLLEARDAMSDIPSPFTLFRGINVNIVDHLTVGSVIQDRGFSSFTYSLFNAEKFSRNIIVWNIPENSSFQGISFNSKSETSFYDENEILMGPGLSLIISDIITEDEYTFYVVEFNQYIDINSTLEKNIDLKFRFIDIFEIMRDNINDCIIINNKIFMNYYVEKFYNYYVDFTNIGIKSFSTEFKLEPFGDYIAFFLSMLNGSKNVFYLAKGHLNYLVNNSEQKFPITVNFPDNFTTILDNYDDRDLVKYVSSRYLKSWNYNGQQLNIDYFPFSISS